MSVHHKQCFVFLVFPLEEKLMVIIRSHNLIPTNLHHYLSTLILTVGPCALEYTKMKTADHFWTDPSADELVQRHRIHGGHFRQDSPTKRPALCVSTKLVDDAELCVYNVRS